MNSASSKFFLSLKGMAMGIAEVIPGVSGGTIAFITGIYEQLLASIKSVGPGLIGDFKEGGFSAVWEKINGTFLLFLMIGMAFGFLVGVFGVSWLLENYPVMLWAFFFGLICASVLYVGKQVKPWGLKQIIALVAAAAVAYYITIAAPAQGSDAPWFIFLSGAIAISALMLPGLSGSFMLLLMGMYTKILPALKDLLREQAFEHLPTVGIFVAGCLVGLMTFSRILSYTFEHYRNTTMAALTGFMIGSLNKVWPWQEVITTRMNSHGETVPAFTQSVLPGHFSSLAENPFYGTDPYLIGCLVLMVLGFLSVFTLSAVSGKPSESQETTH